MLPPVPGNTFLNGSGGPDFNPLAACAAASSRIVTPARNLHVTASAFTAKLVLCGNHKVRAEIDLEKLGRKHIAKEFNKTDTGQTGDIRRLMRATTSSAASQQQAFDCDAQSHGENAPGLVYRFLLRDDGSQAFPYLSRGCRALLGVSPQWLRRQRELLAALIVPEDRASYFAGMRESAQRLSAWNWEGRIRIEAWQDIKWINLRAAPRRLPGVGVQWDGLMTNITHGKRAEQEILRSRRQLEELSAHVDRVKEEERKRIAQEIHDDLGGNLTAIKMALAQLAQRLAPNAPHAPDAPQLAQRLAYVDALVDRSIEAAQRISRDLRPGILDLGVIEAIAWQAREFEKQSGIPCELLLPAADIPLAPDRATALFRIFQEALTNIGKHAGARAVRVRLEQAQDRLHLWVADDGRGLGAGQRPQAFGIRGMRERAHALGGEFEIGNGEHGGCVLSVWLPKRDAGQRGQEAW
jgi:signal transduction histidine kinase